jgi:uncharacterized protein YndB with AHSA1/START domain
MKPMKFIAEISASRQKVWDTLWQDKTLRQWAGIIDPGTHMVGELKQGSEVQFISGNGYGVTSLVDKIIPGEYLLLRHEADTQDTGTRERQKQWTGGKEIYQLSEKDEITTLTIEFDVPTELEETFNQSYPKALDCIKKLSEMN